MATKYWLGNDSGNEGKFNTAANWSPSGVPADGDDLVFDGRAGIVPAGYAGYAPSLQTVGNHFNVVEDFDQSAKKFAAVTVTSSYTGSIGRGVDGDYYYALECAATKITFKGTGSFYFLTKHATDATPLIICDTANGAMFVGKCDSNGQEITKIINVKGSVEVLETYTPVSGDGIAAPDLEELVSLTSNATTIIQQGNTGTLEIENILGLTYVNSDITQALVSGGHLYIGDTSLDESTELTVDTVECNGGDVDWRAAGTLKGLKVRYGTVQALGDGAKTLGDSTVNSGTIEVDGGTLDLSTAGVSVALGSSCEVVVRGEGEFVPPADSDITW